jgi:hypothetical protein
MMKRLIGSALVFGALALASPQVAAAHERDFRQDYRVERRPVVERRVVVERRIGDLRFGFYDVHHVWCWY